MIKILFSSNGRNVNTDKNSGQKRRSRWRKNTLLLISVTVLIVCVVGVTMSFLVNQTFPTKNTFTAGKVSCSIDETFDGETKSNISVKNTGNTSAYIRADVVVTWQDSDGNVYGMLPVEGIDYSMTQLGSGWILGADDGYYYCTSPVEPTMNTPELFSSIERLDTAPEGYFLVVEILADAIQAAGTDSSGKTPIELSWGINPTTWN